VLKWKILVVGISTFEEEMIKLLANHFLPYWVSSRGAIYYKLDPILTQIHYFCHTFGCSDLLFAGRTEKGIRLKSGAIPVAVNPRVVF